MPTPSARSCALSYNGSDFPASRRLFRRCCASGIALATKPQKSVEWFRWVRWAALDWNKDAHRFYEDLGAEMLPEWRVFRIHGDALRQLAEDEDRSTH